MRTHPDPAGAGRLRAALLAAALLAPALNAQVAPPARAGRMPADPLAWPAVRRTMRPWTRWWWLGSAVDKPNLQRMLRQFHQAGIGGVEIIPIYGVHGYEKDFIPYLSENWMRMLGVTSRTAARLGLGVDLTTGTGWPMGGPWIPKADTSENVRVVAPTAPRGHYTLAFRQEIQRVKRAAPGGRGWVIDPYSIAALDTYLSRFNEAFLNYGGPVPRAEFQDSFEYFGANWCPGFAREFQRRRGYDLLDHLEALAGKGNPEIAARVREDYRRTIAELHLAFVAHWTAWAHIHGSLTREQAHGAPANIEDVYAAADIPETEGTFGGPTVNELPMMKFATSAAHATGRLLASSETFTWLGEHFSVPLARLKPAVDTFFLAGVNHIFFQGIPYSPAGAPWPGWQFYAAVNFGPNGGIWHDLPAFNAYVTRCQSILQSGRPDNDVLLYFPVADFWQTAGPAAGSRGEADPLVIPFTTPGKWMSGSPFHRTAMAFWRRGVSYDEVTDELLSRAGVDQGEILLGADRYRAIVLPPCRFLPVATLQRLVALADAGGRIVVAGPPPGDVPGYSDYLGRRNRLRKLWASLGIQSERTAVGRGAFLVGRDLDELLADAGVHREAMTDLGLHALRRTCPDGTDYFIVNPGAKAVNGWVPLSRPGAYAALLDPLRTDRTGRAALRGPTDSPQVYLQVPAGGSVFVRLFGPDAAARFAHLRPWIYVRPEPSGARVLAGAWSVRFLQGGPALPRPFTTSPEPAPWTGRGGPNADRFAGTARYTLHFTFQPSGTGRWELELGQVANSARVRLNGREVATLWCPPFRVSVGAYLRPGDNVLEIDLTNVAANRIRDLDRRHVRWKIFMFDGINFVNREYRPFNATDWPVRVSGLAGPVRLVPLRVLHPGEETR
ncbi:MAG: glycosyl hydrolase [Opitutaceae bacterium]